MKTKDFFRVSLLVGVLFLGMENIYAQPKNKIIPAEPDAAVNPDRSESLSGINLFPDRKTGNFRLRFTQALKENGNLEIRNATGKVLFAKELSPTENYTARPFEIGKLENGIYLIEVKAANTTYWKKVKVVN